MKNEEKEVRGRKSGVRRQRAGDRGQRPEVGGQRSEDRDQRAEVGRQKSGDRRRLEGWLHLHWSI